MDNSVMEARFEDLKDLIKDKFDHNLILHKDLKQIMEGQHKRISSLERWKWMFSGVIGVAGIAFSYLFAPFLIKVYSESRIHDADDAKFKTEVNNRLDSIEKRFEHVEVLTHK